MRFATEMPHSCLEEFSPLMDMDFALAHLVLENERYAEFYAAQSKAGRQVILDNSFHELGRPLSTPEMKRAVDKVKPWCVVAPDQIGKPIENITWFKEAREAIVGETLIAGVMCGRDRMERLAIFDFLRQKTSIIMWPFRESRLDWMRELAETSTVFREHLKQRYHHLLGVKKLVELIFFRDLFQSVGISERLISVDTAKPIKLGLKNIRIKEDTELQGHGPLDYDAVITDCQQRSDILHNIAFMRKYV